MSGRTVKRVTLSLPPEVVHNMDFVSDTLGVSRSAFVSALMSDLLPSLIPVAQVVSKKQSGEFSDSDARRYMGGFASELTEQIKLLQKDAKGLQDDLSKK